MVEFIDGVDGWWFNSYAISGILFLILLFLFILQHNAENLPKEKRDKINIFCAVTLFIAIMLVPLIPTNPNKIILDSETYKIGNDRNYQKYKEKYNTLLKKNNKDAEKTNKEFFKETFKEELSK